jgi:ABC-type branched-subunit amino acid transport system ATPase component
MTHYDFIHIVLISNAVVMTASLSVGIIYYRATEHLRDIVRKQAENDGQKYAQTFQSMLWQEKKTELEKELVAFKKAHEKVSLELVQMTERFNGLEQAYHEAREQLSSSGVLMAQADAEEGKVKRKRKPKSA